MVEIRESSRQSGGLGRYALYYYIQEFYPDDRHSIKNRTWAITTGERTVTVAVRTTLLVHTIHQSAWHLWCLYILTSSAKLQ